VKDLRVETERLIIRNWRESDIDPYAELSADPEVMRYIGDGQPRTREYAESFVHRMMDLYRKRGWIRFAVEHRETGEFMGFCGYDELPDGTLDFGWRYAQDFWGGGYGSEAAIAVLAIGRERYGLKNIQSMSYPENAGSVRIMEKMGMSFLRESKEDGRRIVHYGFPDEAAAAESRN
jgi:RimJ/RimL family protein N-acetyltransferase